MSSNKIYRIPFEGLKTGKHTFEFEISNEFFEELEYSIIRQGDLKAVFTLDKKENMMVGDVIITGTVTTACDRCTDPVENHIETQHQLVFKFSDEPSDDEDLITLPSNVFAIDTSPIFYELMTVSLPSRTVHEENSCNEEMLRLIKEYTGSAKQTKASEKKMNTGDPRWDALKNLN
ncbi:MAG: DUF177 domain-containing protein [Brumimicrobium sp.]|nr:DUF177 domain-containing protein [Brumimicrobium sp.]